MRRCLPLLLTAFAALAGAADVELVLADGRTVRGEFIAEADGRITVRARFPARGQVKRIDTSYPVADVLRRKDLPSPEQQYAERAERTPETIPELCSLAQWCYENGMREQARTQALRVLALDATNAWARRILDNAGYLELEGRWVDEEAYLKEQGLVRLDGELVKAEIAEARRDARRAIAARSAARSKVESLRAGSNGGTGAEAKAKSAEAAAEAAGKAVEAAEEALAKLRDQPPARGDDARRARDERIAAAQKALQTARLKEREAQKASDEAKRTAESEKRTLDTAKRDLPEAEKALAKAEADLVAALAKLPANDPVVAEAKPKDEAPADAKPEPKTKPGSDAPAEPAQPEPKPRKRLQAGGD
jgi:colicin import membrane protein